MNIRSTRKLAMPAVILLVSAGLFFQAAPLHGAGTGKKKTTPPPPASGAATRPITTGPMTSLAGAAGLPSYLLAADRGLADAEGYHGGLRGADADLGTHDFTFDVLVTLPANEKTKSKGKGFVVGIGKGPDKESDKPGHTHLPESVYLRVGGTGAERAAALSVEKTNYELGRFAAAPGPHLVRIQRMGNELIVSVTANYKAGATPTVVGTVPDLTRAAPFLTATNASLFLKGEAAWAAVSLTVNGKPVDGGVAATAPREAGPAALTNLGETKRLPEAFEPRRDVQIGTEGLEMSAAHGIRTRTGDFINKDFTLDVVYSWADDVKRSKNKLTVGLGDGGRVETSHAFGREHAAAAKSNDAVCFRLEGGDVAIAFEGTKAKARGSSGPHTGIEVAKLGDADRGPHRLRLRKHGDTLTVEFQGDYKGQFAPQFTKTIPSLKAEAPFLDGQNSYVFVQGDSGTIHQLQLTVEGESVLVADRGGLSVPRFAVEGVPLRQMLDADPKTAAGKRYALDPVFSAPRGLAVSPAGELSWTPAHEQIGNQTFKVDVTENGRTTSQAMSIEVVSADDAREAGGDLSKIAALYTLKIESEDHDLVPGLGGTSLLLEGDQVRRLGPDGLSVVQTLTLPRIYSKIGERADCFVAFGAKDKLIDVLDKKTLKARQSGQVAYHTCNSLCLDPVKPVSYLAVEKGLAVDTSQIVVFDERTGAVREPAGCVGSFACISPDGQRLYTAYRRTFETGMTINQATGQLMPTYGDESKLFVFDISGEDPRHVASIREAGANGQGIALSPDGKRVSYLSYVGFPVQSGNIPAWDTSDLRKVPVGYPCKAHHADCKRVAYDPTLPIAASPTSTAPGVACFNRETGEFEADRVIAASPLPANTKVTHVYFSPDGRSILLDCDRKGDRFLKRVKLNLSDAELAVARQAMAAKK